MTVLPVDYMSRDWVDAGFPDDVRPGDHFVRTRDVLGREIAPTEEEAVSYEEAVRHYQHRTIVGMVPGSQMCIAKSFPVQDLAKARKRLDERECNPLSPRD